MNRYRWRTRTGLAFAGGAVIMLTACAGAPGDVVTSKPPSPTAASGGEAGYQVTFRAVSKRRTAPVATVTYPEASVTGGPDPTVRAAIETALRQTIDARRKEYDQSLDGEDPSDTSTQRITVTSQVRWGHLLSVEFLNETYRGGEPHPNTDLPAATVDLRTGKQVRTTDLYRDVAPVDAVLLKALTAKQTGTSGQEEKVTGVTVGKGTDDLVSLDSYPTPSGLWVGVPRCILACAFGIVEVVLPWKDLPAPAEGVLSTGTPAVTLLTPGE